MIPVPDNNDIKINNKSHNKRRTNFKSECVNYNIQYIKLPDFVIKSSQNFKTLTGPDII